MARYISDTSSPSGFRKISSGASPVYTPGVSGGTYTDAQGRPITQGQAMSSGGSIDAPGTTAATLQKIGGSSPGTTVAAEQRLAREDIAKQQVKEGRFSQQDIAGAKALLESKTAQFAGQTPEQQQKIRQALYEQTIYRAPSVKPATEYIPYKSVSEQQAIQDFKRGIGLGYITTAQKALTPKDTTKYTSEADIRYVTIGGKQRLFINPSLVKQREPFAPFEKRASEAIIRNTPVQIADFVDIVDRRAQASFTGPKSKNPFALRNVAEAVFGIERGITKGAVEQPLTTAGSYALGYGVSKGIGLLSKATPILTKGIGAGKVASKISAMNIAGGAMAGFYGSDVIARIAVANDRYEKLGEILGTEIIPFTYGARLATPRTIQKTEVAQSKFNTQLNKIKDKYISDKLPLSLRNEFVLSKAALKSAFRQGENPLITKLRAEGSAVPKSYGKSSFGGSEMIPKTSPKTTQFLSKKQIQRVKAVKAENEVNKDYIQNVSDYIDDIRVELTKLNPSPKSKGTRTVKSLGTWDFKLNKFVRTGAAEARASTAMKAKDVFDIMERRNVLKAKLQELESGFYEVPEISKPQVTIFKPKPRTTILDLSRAKKGKTVNPMASFLASVKAGDISLVQRIRPQELIQIQKPKPTVSPRPKFNTQEGYYKKLTELSPTKTQNIQNEILRNILGISSVSILKSGVGSIKGQKLIKSNIQSNIQHVTNLQGNAFIQAVTQAQGQTQGQLQGQFQGLKTQQITLQRQLQVQKQRITQKTKTPTEPIKKPPTEKNPPPLKIPSFKSKVNDIAKRRKKKGKIVWDIKNPVPDLESLTG